MKRIYIWPAYDLTVGLTLVLRDVAIMGTLYVLRYLAWEMATNLTRHYIYCLSSVCIK